MLTALIILILISLLVATEAEPAGSSVETRGEPPLRPGRKPSRGGDGPKRDRMAA